MGCIITPSGNFEKLVAHKNRSYHFLPFSLVNRWTAETSQPIFESFFHFAIISLLSVSRAIFLTVPMFLHLSESVDSSFLCTFLFFLFASR